MSFYDNSPGMVDDITPKPTPEEAVAAAIDAADTADDQSEPVEEDGPGEVIPERSPFAADVAPYGSHVGMAVQRAAEVKGEDLETAKGLASGWVQAFSHFGVPDHEIDHLVGAGLQVADGPPTPEVEATWQSEAKDRLAFEFGGPEAGARALATARDWVQKHPQLAGFLQRTRLGNHPRVVVAIANTASMARKAGKF